MGTSTARRSRTRIPDPPKTPEQLLQEQQEREAAARHREWQEQLKEKIIEAMTHLDDRDQFIVSLVTEESQVEAAIKNLDDQDGFISSLITKEDHITEALTNNYQFTDNGKFITRLLTDEDIKLDSVDKSELKDHFDWKDEDDSCLPMPGNLADAAKLRDFIESQNWIEQEVPAMLSFL